MDSPAAVSPFTVATPVDPQDDDTLDPDVPKRLMRVKVLYSFDDKTNTNCLARLPNALQIPTVELDEGANIGIIELQSCIEAVVSASPELTTNIDTDYTVYAYDFSEFENPLVGHGMLSKVLGSATPTFGTQSKTMITGRVQRNVMGFFKGGIKETLEVKLKLTPVPRQNAWAGIVLGPNGDVRPSSRNPRAGSMSSNGGMESINQLLYPQHGNENEPAASIEFSPQVSRAPSPTPSGYSRAPTQQLSPASISGSVIDDGASRKNAPRGRGLQSKKSVEEIRTEGQPSRKRAKLTRAESRHKASAFSKKPESLRVAASTAASVRSLGFAQSAETGDSNEAQPRAPTPRPERQLAPRRRGRPSNASRLATQTSFEDIPSDGTVCPEPRNRTDADTLDSAVYFEEGDMASTGPSPSDFPSSPPRLATSPTPFTTRDESMTPSSPQLPTIPVFNDSGFMSECGGERPEYTRSPQRNFTSQSNLPIDTDMLTESAPAPSEPRSDFVVECYGNPALLPKKMPPRPVYPKRLVPYVPAMPYWMSPKSRAAASQNESIPGSPVVPPLTLDAPTSRPGTPLPSAAMSDAQSESIAHPQNQPAPGVQRREQGRPPLERQFSQISQASTTDQYAMLPPHGTQTASGRGSFSQPGHSQSSYQMMPPSFYQGPPGATPSAYAESEIPDEPRSGAGATRMRIATSEPRSGGNARRKKDMKRNEVDKVIASGAMPRFCANCGEIDTPTWRKAFTRMMEGDPANVKLSFKEGRIVGTEDVEKDITGAVVRYRVYKKTLTVADQKENCYEMVRLCNPCGLWFDKKGSMRPSAHWVKPPPGVAQKRAARQPKEGKDPKKRRKSSADDGDIPTSEFETSDPQHSTEVMTITKVPSPALPDSAPVEQPRNSLPAGKRPRAASMQPRSSLMDNIAQWNHDVSTAMRGIQSSPARLGNTKESPIEVVDDLSPKPTRRLLFPSPRKAGEFKSLDESSPKKTAKARKSTDKPVIIFEDVSVADKENHVPMLADEDDGLNFLFEGSTPIKTPKSGKSIRAFSDIFKTPTPIKQRRNALSPRSPNSSARRRRAVLLMTPTRSTRAAKHSTPFTVQLNQMLSDGLINSPSGGFDFSNLPPLDTPSRRSGILSFADFSADDFLSTDMIMPSSPPKGLFAFYQDPASDRNLWSGSGIFGSSDAAHMLDSDETSMEETYAKTGEQVDLDAIIDEVVNETGKEL